LFRLALNSGDERFVHLVFKFYCDFKIQLLISPIYFFITKKTYYCS
jgi:hypothetical protein